MKHDEDIQNYFSGMMGGNWDAVREELSRYRSVKLASLSVQDSYEEFLGIYETWAKTVPSDLEPLLKQEAEDRISMVQKRQAAYRLVVSKKDRESR